MGFKFVFACVALLLLLSPKGHSAVNKRIFTACRDSMVKISEVFSRQNDSEYLKKIRAKQDSSPNIFPDEMLIEPGKFTPDRGMKKFRRHNIDEDLFGREDTFRLNYVRGQFYLDDEVLRCVDNLCHLIYVVDQKGRVYAISTADTMNIFAKDLAKNKAVVTAGEITIRDHTIIQFSNYSKGEFESTNENFLEVVIHLLKDKWPFNAKLLFYNYNGDNRPFTLPLSYLMKRFNYRRYREQLFVKYYIEKMKTHKHLLRKTKNQ